ncbi:hypothetical protein AGMMS50268_23790 [Spirochaetia bacterium]|nr:hypothetical protein AGMMS50268_23790 [Spirochaetia bacterium]
MINRITPPPSILGLVFRLGLHIYRILPFPIKNELWRLIDNKRYRLRKEIIRCFKNKLKNNPDEEIQEIYNYLLCNYLTWSPYNFRKMYKPENITVYTDNDCNMKYVLHDNKRLYFCRNWNNIKIQIYYNGLLIQEDKKSPHRYEFGQFCVNKNDIVADIGAAEGIFALSIVEKAQKIYLFECEDVWIDALQMTFAPWKEKIVIINKYISDTNENNCITLDAFLNGNEINFIKADIEGAELSLLTGAKDVLSTQDNLRIVLCTYHKQNDEQELKQVLIKYGFYTEYSKGYMIPYWDKELAPPYLRRGVIRAIKNRNNI